MREPLSASVEEPSLPGAESMDREARSGGVAWRWIEQALLAVAAVFTALHFVHLKADFPNYSFWKDWAKYTDEGWYGDAAIRHYQLGHWNVPGDFNPAAALPVWPMLEMALFRVNGVSLVAARALTVCVFAVTLTGCFLLMRRWQRAGPRGTGSQGIAALSPALVVVLLAVSPFCFAFTRMAILEPLLVLLMVAAMLVGSEAGASAERGAGSAAAWWTAALGLLFPAMVLTKTTAVFLFPAILWLVWAGCGYVVRTFLQVAAPAACLGAVVWGVYYGLFVRPHYLADYRYLFAANAYTAFTWKGLPLLLFNTTFDGIWIGKTLFALALLAMAGAVVQMVAKGVRGQPLQMAMLLWVLGYGAFLAYHANLQPRYYIVLAVPLTVLVVLVFEPLFGAALATFARPAGAASGPQVDTVLLRLCAAAAGGALVFAAVNAGRQTVGFCLHPEYTWATAAQRIHEAVERAAAASRGRPGHPRMVLSISGSDLSLMTGLPSICDDFGTMSLQDRIAKYNPGWFATWNEVEDDKMEALAPRYRLVRVVTAPAFDDPDRNVIILYRLDPLEVMGPAAPPRHRRTIFVPKSMRTTIHEQPSALQSSH